MADTTETNVCRPDVEQTMKPIQLIRDFNPWVVYLFCLGVSLVFMFFFGLNSPIHTFNSHCDYQWFMTMGNGLVAGKVPYRDLFEQKGPIVYAVFAVACWFPNPQFAIWCIEVLCVSLFLFFCYRIARKFLSPWLSLAVVPLMMAVLSANVVRGLEGSCVEEYCYPIFAYGLLCFLDFIIDRQNKSWRRCFALGICLGILFWVKYTMLEFFIVPLIIWFVLNAKDRNLWRIVRGGLLMLAGFAVVTVPILIAFAACGALDDLFNVYFMLNAFNYGSGNYAADFRDPGRNLLFSFFIGGYYIIMLIGGLVCFAIQYWRQRSGQLLLISAVSSWLMVGLIGAYAYYYLPLMAYAVLGVIYTIKIVTHMLQAVGIVIRRCFVRIIWLTVIVLVGFFAALPLVNNLVEINRPRENYVQLVVADMIAEYNQTAEQPATLFCYLMADCGFYNAAGVIPNVRYFAENSFTREGFPEMFESFDNTISGKLCDFVITYRSEYEANKEFLLTYYHPYINNDLTASTLPFSFYEPSGYGKNEVVILYRN